MKRFLPLFVAVLIPIMAQAVASYTIYPIPHRQVIDESSSASFTSSNFACVKYISNFVTSLPIFNEI